MAPSDYFRRNCYLSVEADEATAVHYVDWFGADNLVFSTDCPHGDSAYPHAVDGFLERGLAPVDEAAVLWSTPCELYRLDPASLGRGLALARSAHA